MKKFLKWLGWSLLVLLLVGAVDGTPLDRHSGKLAAVGPEKREADFQFGQEWLAEVRRFDRAKLDPQEQVTYDILLDFYGRQAKFARPGYRRSRCSSGWWTSGSGTLQALPQPADRRVPAREDVVAHFVAAQQ